MTFVRGVLSPLILSKPKLPFGSVCAIMRPDQVIQGGYLWPEEDLGEGQITPTGFTIVEMARTSASPSAFL